MSAFLRQRTSSQAGLFGPGGRIARDEELARLLVEFRRSYVGLLETASGGPMDPDVYKQRNAELESLRGALSRVLGSFRTGPAGG
ncbi:MAG: hypothetical protein ACRDKW_12915 [Actinomycetota bacterium]